MNKWLKDRLVQAEVRAKQGEPIARLQRDIWEMNQQRLKVSTFTPRNPAPFVQVNTENMLYLIQVHYLTTGEHGFLNLISPLIEVGTNAIVHPTSKNFFTTAELADLLDRSFSGIRGHIRSLLDKYILFEFYDCESVRISPMGTQRPLFIHPAIYYRGNRSYIHPELTQLVLEYDQMNRHGVALPWILDLKLDKKYGIIRKNDAICAKILKS